MCGAFKRILGSHKTEDLNHGLNPYFLRKSNNVRICEMQCVTENILNAWKTYEIRNRKLVSHMLQRKGEQAMRIIVDRFNALHEDVQVEMVRVADFYSSPFFHNCYFKMNYST
jgi:hypothetical protein